MNIGSSNLWLEHKYISLLSYKLDQFKRIDNTTYKFRCPLCGDSEKNKLKTRGYVYEKEGRLRFKCHNCGEPVSFWGFMERVDPGLFQEFRLECVKESGTGRKKVEFKSDIGRFSKPRFAHANQLKSLKKISQLAPNHPAAIYVRDERKIPTNFHYKLYYAPKFVSFVNSLVPNKLDPRYEEPRLIIPFIDQNGYLFGFQGRSFRKKTDLRYVTIMLDETKPKVFGLDGLDFSKECYILEGPIDSMFIPNSLAFGGSDGQVSDYIAKERAVIILDNEPRNEAICKKILNSIQQGYRVVVWPDYVKAKDINDLVLSGMTIPQIMGIIHSNTFQGLSAVARFNQWKKVST